MTNKISSKAIQSGSVAVVTGAGVRIGRAVAVSLARQGSDIVVHYGSSSRQAKDVETEITQYGVRCVTVQADFNEPVPASRQVFEAVKTLGFASILVNSAAIFEEGQLSTTDEMQWDRHQNINLKAPFFLAQQFAKQLEERNNGLIVNLVDWRAEYPISGHVAYTIAKAGLVAQTKILAQELGPNIRVNAIAPGAILPAPGATQKQFEERAIRSPLRQVGHPDAIIDAVNYLLQAQFVTGEILHVTGGEELMSGQGSF